MGTIGIDAGDVAGRPGLRFEFRTERSIRPEPNKAQIRIFNLNPAHRASLEALGVVPVQLEAGYADGLQTLFLGDLRAGVTVRDGADLVTVLEAGDGAAAVRTSRVSIPVPPGTSTDRVLRDVATAVGVSPGNLDDAARKIKSKFPGTGGIFPAGTVLTGSAAREMTRICRSLGLEWSIQQGKLQILERGQALAGAAVKLSKTTGMLDAPCLDSKGVLAVSALLSAEFFPGRLLVLDADRIQGQFRIVQCSDQGDTRGGDWRTDISAERY